MIYCAICGRPTSVDGPSVCAVCAALAPTEVEVDITIPAGAHGEVTAEIQGVPVSLKQVGDVWVVDHLGPES